MENTFEKAMGTDVYALLNSVIPMDHRYFAEHDGSEQAAGRGSGLEKPMT